MEQSKTNTAENLVPVEQVLDDMYKDGYAQSIAKEYYYQHYATDEEKEMMRREDRINNTCCAIFWFGYLLVIAIAIIIECIN